MIYHTQDCYSNYDCFQMDSIIFEYWRVQYLLFAFIHSTRLNLTTIIMPVIFLRQNKL
jgi:hypothetical protein